MNNSVEIGQLDNEQDVDLKKIVDKLLGRWKLFLYCIGFFTIIGVFYIKYTVPAYNINAKIFIDSDSKTSALTGGSNSLMDFSGLIGSSSSVDNEAEIIKTRFLMEQVVRHMKLNIIYYEPKGLFRQEIYQAPFTLNIINSVDTIRMTNIHLLKLSSQKFRLKTNEIDTVINIKDNFRLKGVGLVKLALNNNVYFRPDLTYSVKILSIDERVAQLSNLLNVSVLNKQVTIMDLKFSYPVQKKGEDILNALIKRYIESNLEDKNIIADSTTKFIRNRLAIIGTELGDVEDKQEKYKESNKLADINEQSKLLVQNTSEFRKDLAKAETQVTVVEDLERYLKDEKKNKRVFPTSLLPSDMVFSELMNQYNSLLIERDKLLLSETEQSPFVRNVDDQISGLRRGILANIQSTKNTFVVSRDKLKSQLDQIEGKIGEVPQLEKDYLKLARNQKIKQELYIFLMQKAEETAISKTANISMAKVIDPPKAEVAPASPKKNIVISIACLLGLIFPIGIILLSEALNTTIGKKEDILKYTSVPILGEINHNDAQDNLIVANQGRSAISEQFRALRTNLSFYLTKNIGNVVLLTSSMSGEGKSFTAINLANILALSGRRVLLMELDLRKPGLSAKLSVNNNIGFSNFTIDKNIQIEDIIKPLQINKNMFIISSGPLPPNPAETLISEKMPLLMTALKKDFDFIIMDAPPIGIITDAQLLAQYADSTLYLVRQKITKKDQIRIVEDLSLSGKMKNLGIVVNDIIGKEYGYGYGYGNYGEQIEKRRWQNFFKVLKRKK